jgi:hypothetical protein
VVKKEIQVIAHSMQNFISLMIRFATFLKSIRIKVFTEVKICIVRLLVYHLKGRSDEDEGDRFLWDLSSHIQVYLASEPRRP